MNKIDNSDALLHATEKREIELIDKITKIHMSVFLVYSIALIVFISLYIMMLSSEMAMCENNGSKFCPVIYDSTGIVNKKNPNASQDFSSKNN